MKKYPIVITTIFSPTQAIFDYEKLGHNLIIIGDTKTPKNWKYKNATYLSIEDQLKIFPKFAKITPIKHYARKNIGYLMAMKESDGMIETDDDNLPYDFFPNFILREITTTEITSKKFFNTFSHLNASKEKIWPRGYPLDRITNAPEFVEKKKKCPFPLQQAFADDDSDFDAIYRLTNGKEIKFKKNKHFSLSKHTYAPINSQNTFWKKEAFLFMYLPSTVKSRVTDIYRGYIAQRLIWEIGEQALFLSPSVFQKRNPHNYLHDFDEEIPMYKGIEQFIDALENLSLKGSIEEKMVQLYESLIAEGFIPKKELPILREWIKQVNKILS